MKGKKLMENYPIVIAEVSQTSSRQLFYSGISGVTSNFFLVTQNVIGTKSMVVTLPCPGTYTEDS